MQDRDVTAQIWVLLTYTLKYGQKKVRQNLRNFAIHCAAF